MHRDRVTRGGRVSLDRTTADDPHDRPIPARPIILKGLADIPQDALDLFPILFHVVTFCYGGTRGGGRTPGRPRAHHRKGVCPHISAQSTQATRPTARAIPAIRADIRLPRRRYGPSSIEASMRGGRGPRSGGCDPGPLMRDRLLLCIDTLRGPGRGQTVTEFVPEIAHECKRKMG